MSKKYMLLGSLALMVATNMSGQSLNVNQGGVIYNFPSEITGVMEYSNGASLKIGGHEFTISDITSLNVVKDVVDDNLVLIDYAGDVATVTIASNIMDYIDVTIDGANVSLKQNKEVGDDTGEITYRLAGESSNGSFYLDGSYKCSLELNGLTLTNPAGAAIDIQNGKRIAVRVTENTENTLVDGVGGSQKGAIVCKGHLEFKQKGTLNVTGNASHAIYSKEYIELKNTKLNILGAAKDGINCCQYFMMESGTLNIDKVGDDGIQVAFKDDTDREDEDTGCITIAGGKLNVNVTADAAKGLKCEGDFIMEGGEYTAVISGGGIWDADKLKVKASSCVGADGSILIKDGKLNLTATGGGGKGLNCDEAFTSDGGEIVIKTSGGIVAYANGTLSQNYTGNTDRLNSDYKSSPKGIKADGGVEINGGTFVITTTGKGGEGIESKTDLTINGGDITVRAYDDGINSSKNMYLNGGNLEIMSTGEGDGVDSNANIYVNGGRMQIFGSTGPEQGFDAGDGYGIFFNGGEFLAAGPGGNSVPSNNAGSNSKQAYLSLSQTLSADQTVSVTKDGETLVSFVIPADYKSSGNGGRPGGGGWPGGGMGGGGTLVLSCPTLVSGTSYTVTVGTTSTSVTAK